MMYTDKIDKEHYDYIAKPFNRIGNKGKYIGTQKYEDGPYDVFVFKNIIKTNDDKYIKIALPHNEDDWHEDKKYPDFTYIPQKEVMSIYKKGRGFPTYLFYYLGYPGPILLDAITSPVQIFIIGCLAI